MAERGAGMACYEACIRKTGTGWTAVMFHPCEGITKTLGTYTTPFATQKLALDAALAEVGKHGHVDGWQVIDGDPHKATFRIEFDPLREYVGK